MYNSKEVHLQAAYGIIYNLKKSLRKRTIFKKNDKLLLEIYTSADYARSIVKKKSTTRYCTFLEAT